MKTAIALFREHGREIMLTAAVVLGALVVSVAVLMVVADIMKGASA